MSEQNGVCTIVPRGQSDFRPVVFGMGILVNACEVVTCAHVIDAALGPEWLEASTPPAVHVCFPFTEGPVCLEGCVDRKRSFPPGRSKSGEPSDIAVIQLTEDAPDLVQRALLRTYVVDASVKAYGFRGKEVDGQWRSHPYGEWAEGKVIGPQPGGRVQFDGLRTTGARVEGGFSGSAVYDREQDAVVGMVVEADRDMANKIAQFIDVPTLRKALGIELSSIASASPKAWILVAGTGGRWWEANTQLDEKLERTCITLGESLARSDYGLVTGGWPGVDDVTARSFARGLEKNALRLEDRLIQVIREGALPAFPAGNLVLVHRGEEEWTESVKRAEAIILIGGVGGTWTTGEFALKSGRLVLPLADTGGDAAKFYIYMLGNWKSEFAVGIDRAKFQVVAREAPEVIGKLIELLDEWKSSQVGILPSDEESPDSAEGGKNDELKGIQVTVTDGGVIQGVGAAENVHIENMSFGSAPPKRERN
jgi:hypothetical protein